MIQPLEQQLTLLTGNTRNLSGEDQLGCDLRLGTIFLTGEWTEDMHFFAYGLGEDSCIVDLLLTFVCALHDGQGLDIL